MTAADLLARWRRDLESWAIPADILAKTSESPWVLPHQVFARRAERRREAPSGPSFERAFEALAVPGTVLDVGAGAGAACLPLAPRATAITAVDTDSQMLRVLAETAGGIGPEVTEVCGRWPDVAGDLDPADVVTCHHVLYNVADLKPFVAELTNHARRLVVVEITARHPLSSLNPLWEQFHEIRRPEVPTARDVLGILEALGLAPAHEIWSRPRELEYDSFDDLVEVTTRRLCLDPSRAGEVAEALSAMGSKPGLAADFGSSSTDLFTIWWEGLDRSGSREL